MSSFYAVLTQASHDVREDTLIQEIQTNLTLLLNARQYMLSTQHDYGLPDICAEYTANYQSAVVAATRALITQFEPRLHIKQIVCLTGNSPHNQLDIMVVAEVLEHRVTFSAKVGSQLPSRVSLI